MKRRTQKGSALLIALFIMASVGAVSFSSAKIFVSQLKSVSHIGSSVAAYYQAEGALENGLLEFRKDRNIQKCEGMTNDVCLSSDRPEVISVYPAPDGTVSASQRIVYYSPSFGDERETDKDEVTELKIKKVSGSSSANLSWNWEPQTAPGSTFFVKIFNQNDDVISENSFFATAKNASIPLSGGITTVRFKPLGGKVKWKVEKAAPGDVVYFDSGTVTLDAIGESQNTNFGKVKRQLRAVLDREDGSLDSIFDYALLTKEEI